MNPDIVSKLDALSLGDQPFLFIIDFLGTSAIVATESEAQAQGISFNFNGRTNATQKSVGIPITLPIGLQYQALGFSSYQRAFDKVIHYQNKGFSYLLNLSFATPVTTQYSFEEIFTKSQAAYKLWVKDQFIVFSPECFVQIKDGTIATYPMKGTISAGLPDAQARLLSSEKEKAEHATIVDLLRNDLNQVARNVRVEKYRTIAKIDTDMAPLYATSSVIKGQLKQHIQGNLGSVLEKLMPAGSVTGAPKDKTVAIICEIENQERGFYTGVAGFFHGEELDSCVLIRFLEKINGQYFYRSGGGITAQSRGEDEYGEMLSKIYLPFS